MAKPAGRPPRSENEISEFRAKIGRHALAIYRAEGFAGVSIRRLAREVGCAPMTIYAHFDGKIDILRYLWGAVLAEMSDEIRQKLEHVVAPAERLQTAAQSFVAYWVEHPDHFRLVFMSNDVTRSDVSIFIMDEQTLKHFQLIADLVQEALPDGDDHKAQTDTLISGMIGIALCINTCRDYQWASPQVMTDRLLTSVVGVVESGSSVNAEPPLI